MVRYNVTLTEKEREQLLSVTKGGVHTSKKIIHALILLNCDEGKFSDKVNNGDVAKVLKIGDRTIGRVKKKFVERGLRRHWKIVLLQGYMTGKQTERLKPIWLR